jgi:hypothetical protein
MWSDFGRPSKTSCTSFLRWTAPRAESSGITPASTASSASRCSNSMPASSSRQFAQSMKSIRLCTGISNLRMSCSLKNIRSNSSISEQPRTSNGQTSRDQETALKAGNRSNITWELLTTWPRNASTTRPLKRFRMSILSVDCFTFSKWAPLPSAQVLSISSSKNRWSRSYSFLLNCSLSSWQTFCTK